VQRQQTPADPAGPILPNAGDRVEAVLLDAKTRKGGWKAKHEPTGLSGPIQNSADVPDDLRPGNSLELIVASASKREIAFRYPTSADEQRNQRAKGKPKGSSGGRR
jgi:CRISPR-associated protein Cmr6